jgi:hypothetical protein
MTTPMRVQQSIRQLEGAGLKHTQIAASWVYPDDRGQVRGKGGFLTQAPAARAEGRSLVDDGHARIVDGWLTADLRLSGQAAAYRQAGV